MRWREPYRNSPSFLVRLGFSQLSKAHVWFNFHIVPSALLCLQWGPRFCYWVFEFSVSLSSELSMCCLSHPLHLFVPVAPGLALQKSMVCPFLKEHNFQRHVLLFPETHYPFLFILSSLHLVILLFICSTRHFVSVLFALGMILLQSC